VVTISISADALAAIEATLPDGREAELSQDVRDLIHRKVEDWDVNMRSSGTRAMGISPSVTGLASAWCATAH
jgi:hypothetical protein